MKTALETLLAAAVVFGLAAPASAEALTSEKARELVQPFYDLFNPGGDVAKARAVFHPDWKSYYATDGFKTLDQTMGFIGGPLRQMVPDLTWEIKSVSVTDKNEIVVRGEGSGTPVGESFFGQPVTGKSFRIMSIDVHAVKDGKVVTSHHIEDWFRAMAQLRADAKQAAKK